MDQSHYPLSKYAYSNENLATDLQDGVRSTWLAGTSHEDVINALPKGEVLSTASEKAQFFGLLQHLKFTCTARAQSIYNVQVTLDTLRAVRGVDQFVEDLKAEEQSMVTNKRQWHCGEHC